MADTTVYVASFITRHGYFDAQVFASMEQAVVSLRTRGYVRQSNEPATATSRFILDTHSGVPVTAYVTPATLRGTDTEERR